MSGHWTDACDLGRITETPLLLLVRMRVWDAVLRCGHDYLGWSDRLLGVLHPMRMGSYWHPVRRNMPWPAG